MYHHCKDCRAHIEAGFLIATVRPAPHPGPRCASHDRAERKRRSEAAHAKRVARVYGLAEGGYQVLYELQGGRCALCLTATGKTKRLAVDHDHQSGAVRGLLCSVCNRMLGHARDEVQFFERAARYLLNPPARKLPPRYFTEETDGEGP